MFLNRYKTLVLALLVVGFFCFLGGVSVVKTETEESPYAVGEGPADLDIIGTVTVGNQATRWGGTVILTPDDNLTLSRENNTASFNIVYSEKNNGGAEALTYRNEITFDGNMVSQQTNRTLASLNTSEVLTQAYFTLGDDTYEMVLTLDADDQIREGNEADNIGTIYVKFSGFGESETDTTEARPEAVESDATEDTEVQMSCGDSAGGDGSYTMCKGDTVYHNGNFTVYNRAYDGSYLKLYATNLTESYIRLEPNVSYMVYHTDRQHAFLILYTGESDEHGAMIRINETELDTPVSDTTDTDESATPTSGGGGEAAPSTSEGGGESAPTTSDGGGSATDTEEEVRTCEVISSGGQRVIAFGGNKVYYVYNNYKYWFPNEEVYLSWFANFAGIKVISQAEMDSYSTGSNVCQNTAGSRLAEKSEKAMLPAFDEEIRRTPNTAASEATGMSCGDSEGGDGLYSACKGDTIHHTSGIKILIRAYDTNVVKFMLDGADKKYVRTSINNAVKVNTDDGAYLLSLTYKEKSAEYGAFVEISTSAVGDEESADVSDVEEESEVESEPVAEEVEEETDGVNIEFKISVNNWPEHNDYSLNENLSDAYVNMYKMTLHNDGFFHVLSSDTRQVNANTKYASFSVAPGEMVYFEGFKTSAGASAGKTAKAEIGWSAPPYKNFSAGNRVKDKLCQTNFTDTNTYLSCGDNLSTPYKD